MVNLATVLTVRTGSERLPGKVIADIGGVSLIEWIYKRLRKLPGETIIATTDREEDYVIALAADYLGAPLYRGDTNDVVSRVNNAVNKHAPNANFVFRALGDCPFVETNFVLRSLKIMSEYNKDAFLWHLAPDTWPVYGAREFPLSRKAWNTIVENATGDQREHTDQYFHDNRDKFSIIYHESPPSRYFRQYRLEVDWKEDLELIRQIHNRIGMKSELSSVIRFLDMNSDVAKINRHRVEKTGPLSTYRYSERRKWMKSMIGQPVIGWDDHLWKPPSDNAVPIFCQSGTCFLGYGDKLVLHKRNKDQIKGEAYIHCSCGSGKFWNQPIRRKKKS